MPEELVLPLGVIKNESDQGKNKKLGFDEFINEVYGGSVVEKDASQFTRLINAYFKHIENKKWLSDEEINNLHDALEAFKQKINEGLLPALEAKSPFEKIAYHIIKNDSIDIETKKECIIGLTSPLQFCIEGARGELQSRLMSLDAASITDHLAAFAQGIVETAAIKRLGIFGGEQAIAGGIHTRNRFAILAYDMGFAIMGAQPNDKYPGSVPVAVIPTDIKNAIDQHYTTSKFLEYINATISNFVVNLDFKIENPEIEKRNLEKLQSFTRHFGLDESDVLRALNFKFKMPFEQMSDLISKILPFEITGCTYSTSSTDQLAREAESATNSFHIANEDGSIKFITANGTHEIISEKDDKELYEELAKLATENDIYGIAALIGSNKFRSLNTEFLKYKALNSMFEQNLLSTKDAALHTTDYLKKTQTEASLASYQIRPNEGDQYTFTLTPVDQSLYIFVENIGQYVDFDKAMQNSEANKAIHEQINLHLSKLELKWQIEFISKFTQKIDINLLTNFNQEKVLSHILTLNGADLTHFFKGQLIKGQIAQGPGNRYYDFLANKLIPNSETSAETLRQLVFYPPQNNIEKSLNKQIMQKYVAKIQQDPTSSNFEWFKGRGELLNDWLNTIGINELEKFINDLPNTPENPQRKFLSTSNYFKDYIAASAPEPRNTLIQLQVTSQLQAQKEEDYKSFSLFFANENTNDKLGQKQTYNDELLAHAIAARYGEQHDNEMTKESSQLLLPFLYMLSKESAPLLLRWAYDKDKETAISIFISAMGNHVKTIVASFRTPTILKIISHDNDSLLKQHFHDVILPGLAPTQLTEFLITPEGEDKANIKFNDSVLLKIYESPTDQLSGLDFIELFMRHPAAFHRLTNNKDFKFDLDIFKNSGEIFSDAAALGPNNESNALVRLLSSERSVARIMAPDPETSILKDLFFKNIDYFDAETLARFLTNYKDDVDQDKRIKFNDLILKKILDSNNARTMYFAFSTPDTLVTFVNKNANYLSTQTELFEPLVKYLLTKYKEAQATLLLPLMLTPEVQDLAFSENSQIKIRFLDLFSAIPTEDLKVRFIKSNKPENHDANNRFLTELFAHKKFAADFKFLCKSTPAQIITWLTSPHFTAELKDQLLGSDALTSVLLTEHVFSALESGKNKNLVDLFEAHMQKLTNLKTFKSFFSNEVLEHNALVLKGLTKSLSNIQNDQAYEAAGLVMKHASLEAFEFSSNQQFEEFIGKLGPIRWDSVDKAMHYFFSEDTIKNKIPSNPQSFISRYFFENYLPSINMNDTSMGYYTINYNHYTIKETDQASIDYNYRLLKMFYDKAIVESKLELKQIGSLFSNNPAAYARLLQDSEVLATCFFFDDKIFPLDKVDVRDFATILMIDASKHYIAQEGNKIHDFFIKNYTKLPTYALRGLLSPQTGEEYKTINLMIMDAINSKKNLEWSTIREIVKDLTLHLYKNLNVNPKDNEVFSKILEYIISKLAKFESTSSVFSDELRQVLQSKYVVEIILPDAPKQFLDSYYSQICKFTMASNVRLLEETKDQPERFRKRLLRSILYQSAQIGNLKTPADIPEIVNFYKDNDRILLKMVMNDPDLLSPNSKIYIEQFDFNTLLDNEFIHTKLFGSKAFKEQMLAEIGQNEQPLTTIFDKFTYTIGINFQQLTFEDNNLTDSQLEYNAKIYRILIKNIDRLKSGQISTLSIILEKLENNPILMQKTLGQIDAAKDFYAASRYFSTKTLEDKETLIRTSQALFDLKEMRLALATNRDTNLGRMFEKHRLNIDDEKLSGFIAPPEAQYRWHNNELINFLLFASKPNTALQLNRIKDLADKHPAQLVVWAKSMLSSNLSREQKFVYKPKIIKFLLSEKVMQEIAKDSNSPLYSLIQQTAKSRKTMDEWLGLMQQSQQIIEPTEQNLKIFNIMLRNLDSMPAEESYKIAKLLARPGNKVIFDKLLTAKTGQAPLDLLRDKLQGFTQKKYRVPFMRNARRNIDTNIAQIHLDILTLVQSGQIRAVPAVTDQSTGQEFFKAASTAATPDVAHNNAEVDQAPDITHTAHDVGNIKVENTEEVLPPQPPMQTDAQEKQPEQIAYDLFLSVLNTEGFKPADIEEPLAAALVALYHADKEKEAKIRSAVNAKFNLIFKPESYKILMKICDSSKPPETIEEFLTRLKAEAIEIKDHSVRLNANAILIASGQTIDSSVEALKKKYERKNEFEPGKPAITFNKPIVDVKKNNQSQPPKGKTPGLH